MKNKKTLPLPLAQFLNDVRSILDEANKDTLKNWLLDYASTRPANQRRTFLKKLQTRLGSSGAKQTVIRPETLEKKEINKMLKTINSLVEEAVERIERVENGEPADGEYFYEDDEGYYHTHYDEDENPVLSRNGEDEVKSLFEWIFGYFLQGQFKVAGKLYESIFRLYEFDYTPDIDIDVPAARAQQARCRYENSNRLFDRVNKVTEILLYIEHGYKKYPTVTLKQVYESHPQRPENWEEFLKEFDRSMRENRGSSAGCLLLESAFFQGGDKNLNDKAVTLIPEYPTPVAVHWIKLFFEKEDWKGCIQAAQYSLKEILRRSDLSPEKVENRPFAEDWTGKKGGLAEIYDLQNKAALKVNDIELALDAARHYFLCKNTSDALLRWLGDAITQNRFETELKKAIRITGSWNTAQEKDHREDLHIKLLIVAGNWSSAWVNFLKTRPKSVGWSHANRLTGFMFGCSLYMLTGHLKKKPAQIRELMKCYGDPQPRSWESFYPFFDKENDSPPKKPEPSAFVFSEEARKGLNIVKLSEKEEENMLVWCGEIVDERVTSIVSGQHRNAYDRAALVLVAWSRVLKVRGDHYSAQNVVARYRARFPRHRAFLTALNSKLA